MNLSKGSHTIMLFEAYLVLPKDKVPKDLLERTVQIKSGLLSQLRQAVDENLVSYTSKHNELSTLLWLCRSHDVFAQVW